MYTCCRRWRVFFGSSGASTPSKPGHVHHLWPTPCLSNSGGLKELSAGARVLALGYLQGPAVEAWGGATSIVCMSPAVISPQPHAPPARVNNVMPSYN